VGVAASSVTVGGVGGGSILKGMTWCEKGQQYKWCFLLTHSSPCGTNHSAWKMRRQSYNSEGISETTTLWLRDGYGVVSCTGTNTRTVLIISLNPEYTIPCHSGPWGWYSPRNSDTGGIHLYSIEVTRWIRLCNFKEAQSEPFSCL